MKSFFRLLLISFSFLDTNLISAQSMSGFHIGVNHSTEMFSDPPFLISRQYKQSFLIGAHYSQHINPYLRWNIKGQYAHKDYLNYIYENISQPYLDLIGTVSYCPINQLSIDVGLNGGALLKKPALDGHDKRIDIGYVLGLTAQYKRYVVSMHFNKSLFNQQSSLENYKAFNSTLQFTLGYHINNNKSSKKSAIYEAQDTSYHITEIGLATSSLNYFDFLYKRQISGNLYARLSAFYGNLSYGFYEEGSDVIDYDCGISAGIEKRYELHGHMHYYYGVLPSISFSKNSSYFYIPISINFPIGLYYTGVNHLNLGIEATPSIRYLLSSQNNSISDNTLSIRSGTSNVKLFIMYWW